MTDFEVARLLRALGHANSFIADVTGYPGYSMKIDRAGFRQWRDSHPAEARELRTLISKTFSDRDIRRLRRIA